MLFFAEKETNLFTKLCCEQKTKLFFTWPALTIHSDHMRWLTAQDNFIHFQIINIRYVMISCNDHYQWNWNWLCSNNHIYSQIFADFRSKILQYGIRFVKFEILTVQFTPFVCAHCDVSFRRLKEKNIAYRFSQVLWVDLIVCMQQLCENS